jgi:ApaG protein
MEFFNRMEVSVEVVYSPGHSTAERLFYIYFIAITNTGTRTAQLLRRHFLIRDANGNEQEVDGEGVVGEQPIIEPGQTYRYTSGVPIPVAPGSMRGEYTFRSEEGEDFAAPIPEFMLYEPAGYIPPETRASASNGDVSSSKRVLN